MTPQLGPCDPACNRCGQVCPTGAIQPLPLRQRIWAKVGTAHVLRQKCLAWEFDRQCLVCDEVCPYDAIELKRVPGVKAAVPFVHENRCSGCGYCEHHCPVEALPAIVVAPMEALRLETGAYRARARSIGLDLKIRRTRPLRPESDRAPYDPADNALPPGFSD
jgi:ferredoxin